MKQSDKLKLENEECSLLAQNHGNAFEITKLEADLQRFRSMDERPKLASSLTKLENEYRFGCFTSAKNEKELISEIGRLKAKIQKMPLWTDKFESLEKLSDAITMIIRKKKSLERRITENVELLKQIREAIENAPDMPKTPVHETPQELSKTQTTSSVSDRVPTLKKDDVSTHRAMTPGYGYQKKAYTPGPQNSTSQGQERPTSSKWTTKPKSSSSAQASRQERSEHPGYSVKVINIPASVHIEFQDLKDQLYKIFGNPHELGSCLYEPIKRIYISPLKEVPQKTSQKGQKSDEKQYLDRFAFVSYWNQEDAENAVEAFDKVRLGYNILRVQLAQGRE